MGTPLILAALGGIFSERSGVINIALEGIMLTGAWAAAWFAHFAKNSLNMMGWAPSIVPWLSLAVAALFGMAMAAIHALLSIKYKANQVVSGVAINLLGLGFTTLMTVIVWGNAGGSDVVPPMKTLSFHPIWRWIFMFIFVFLIVYWLLSKFSKKLQLDFTVTIPKTERKLYIFDLVIALVLTVVVLLLINDALYPYFEVVFGSISPITILAGLLVLIAHYIIFYTPFGLRIRSVGEHPHAAATLGIEVNKIRYICVIASGFFAGLGGAFLSIGYTSVFTQNMTAGRGYIALAAVIFGKWSPLGALNAAMLFGLAQALQLRLQSAYNFSIFGFTFDIPNITFSFWEITIAIPPIPTEFFLAFPYLVVLIVITIAVKRSRAPSAIGKPFEKEE